MSDWIHPRWPLAVLLSLLAVATMTGCTAGRGEPSGDSTATRFSPLPPGQLPTGLPTQPADVQQRHDIRDERSISWSRYEIVSGHSIRVYFWLGDLRCFGVRATVTEDASTVRVSVLQGTLPGAPNVCVGSAAYASLLLTTNDPIGTRSVTSG